MAVEGTATYPCPWLPSYPNLGALGGKDEVLERVTQDPEDRTLLDQVVMPLVVSTGSGLDAVAGFLLTTG